MTQMPPLALLAGGLATRLRPLTEKIPKSLLTVAGEPFLAHQLRLFRREGIHRVVLCVGHLWEQISDFAGDGSRFGLELHYSADGERLMGTGGALKKALPLLGHEFLVCYGDSYLDIGYQPVVEAFRQSQKLGLMTVFRNEGSWDTSNVEFDGKSVLSYSKRDHSPGMAHIDWGLGAFRSTAFHGWPSDTPFDLADVYTQLVARGELAAFEVSTRFYEIGSTNGIRDADVYIARQRRFEE